MIGTIADRSRGETKDAMTLLAGLAEGLGRAGRPLNALVASPPADLKEPLERLAPLWPIASTTATSSRPIPERLAALDVLARGRPDLAEAHIPGLLAADQPREIQVAAARAVARVGRDLAGRQGARPLGIAGAGHAARVALGRGQESPRWRSL